MGYAVLAFAVALALMLAIPRKAGGSTPASSGGSAPAPAAAKYPYQNEIQAVAAEYRLDPDLIAAIIAWEQRSSTHWDPNATNPNDPSYGLGQVTPYIAVRFGVIESAANYRELYDPNKNLQAVGRYLNWLYNLQHYGLEDSIQMYNEGEPNFQAGYRVPDYLAGVLRYYHQFRGY